MDKKYVCETDMCDEFGEITGHAICTCCKGLNIKYEDSIQNEDLILESNVDRTKEFQLDYSIDNLSTENMELVERILIMSVECFGGVLAGNFVEISEEDENEE